MGSENFANESPAFAVLYHPDAHNGWSAKVIDLDCGVITGDRCRLTKVPDAYAVVYTPQTDGRWLAEIVDLPGCKAVRPEIAQARVAVKESARKAFLRYEEDGLPIPPSVTLCHYTRPTDFQLNSRLDVTIVEEVAEAVATVVTRHRQEQGTTPRPSSVCGYVSISGDSSEDDPASASEDSSRSAVLPPFR